ncbi:MAG: sulfurtransferase [Gemmataceae bacterium]|nr:sulfurtransferase [Gemmataceae bacterium]
MAPQHTPKFMAIVNEAKKKVRECTVEDVKRRMDAGEKLLIADVREESEYAASHLPGAIHIGKGVMERDIETKVPDSGQEIILYCGGGYRSALAAENLGRMGYTRVVSMDGGVRIWREKGFPLTQG